MGATTVISLLLSPPPQLGGSRRRHAHTRAQGRQEERAPRRRVCVFSRARWFLVTAKAFEAPASTVAHRACRRRESPRPSAQIWLVFTSHACVAFSRSLSVFPGCVCARRVERASTGAARVARKRRRRNACQPRPHHTPTCSYQTYRIYRCPSLPRALQGLANVKGKSA